MNPDTSRDSITKLATRSSVSSDARFLGIDFHALWREVRKAWQGVDEWPVLRWLTPDIAVRLLQADGGESPWLGGAEQQSGVPSRSTQFVAVELPEHTVLRRKLSLPPMAEQDTFSAVALDVRSASPFAPEDLVWGYHADSSRRDVRQVEVALASRKHVAQYLETQTARLQAGKVPEVWACTAQRAPIVFAGYGEGQRTAYARRRRHAGYGLLLLVAGLLVAIAVTPTAQLRLRAIEAVKSYDVIAQRTAPLVRQREALLQSAEKLGSLAAVIAGRIEPLRLLDKLTQLLPDDTSVQSFKIQGTKVTIVGLTANASALMQLLGNESGLRDVRAPSPATRIPGASKESYVIEFSLDPQIYGVVPAPPADVRSQPAPTAAAEPVAAPIPAPPLSAGNATLNLGAPVRPDSGRASFGGGAVFGGTNATRPAPAPASSPAPSATVAPVSRRAP